MRTETKLPKQPPMKKDRAKIKKANTDINRLYARVDPGRGTFRHPCPPFCQTDQTKPGTETI
jgi:hypothetical protein